MFRRGSLSRYLAAMCLWLICLAWVASVWFPFGFSVRSRDRRGFYIVNVKWGSLALMYDESGARESVYDYYVFDLSERRVPAGYQQFLGRMRFNPIHARTIGGTRFGEILLPFATLLTALLPLIVGAFAGFRFRLWQFSAYSALVAVQLAYFLR